MGIEIEVGKEYIFTDLDEDVSKVLIVKVFANGVNVKYIESTFYTPGKYDFYDADELKDYKIEPVEPVKTIEQTDKIKPNPVLLELFINLAIDTKDKEWFKQLAKEKEAIH